PLVLDIEVAPTIAAGPVPWGLGPHLLDLVPGAITVCGTPSDRLLGLAAEHRTVIVATRDAHRHPGVCDLIDDLTRVADVVVHVETGVPGPDRGTTARVDTHGGSWSSLRAAAELLAGSTGRRRQPAVSGHG
ncbi:MAG: glycoside hydrolase family 3 protein, partial [Actinomycetota bacterium]|nr:glycoside hydrolase family 3 protein [Actinomycetota bacterium]